MTKKPKTTSLPKRIKQESTLQKKSVQVEYDKDASNEVTFSVSTVKDTKNEHDLESLLIRSGIVSKDCMRSLKQRSKGEQRALEQLLLNEGHLVDKQLGQLKAKVYGWSFVDLSNAPIDQETYELLPATFLQAQGVVPYTQHGELHIAMSNPEKGEVIRMLNKKFGTNITSLYATQSSIIDAQSRYRSDFTQRCETYMESHRTARVRKHEGDRSIIALVESIVQHGVLYHASDIHIEPRKHESIIRERVDGVLEKVLEIPRDIHDLIATRIKVLSKLATDEHARPQDGKMLFEMEDGKRVDIRVSFSPTTDGEKIVLRLLAVQDRALPLEALGMQSDDLALYEKEAQKSWGMILVTGPTGSGKTTSLYAAVRRLNTESVNIATIEDPVEYDLPGVNQIQVKEKVDVTFANGLRSILRQDPNVILVGEIRDKETAGIAISAAMTGHLVLSTLHTNDAATTLPRLIDMGIEPFLISSTVNAIVAQRLVRTICSRCRLSEDVSLQELKHSLEPDMLKKVVGKKKTVRLYKGEGCEHCHNTGYSGRMGIFEILLVTPEIQQLIMQNADADALYKKAVSLGMRTMLDDGIEKVRQGQTTLEEILRVIRS